VEWLQEELKFAQEQARIQQEKLAQEQQHEAVQG
jgi:hypothetical protein